MNTINEQETYSVVLTFTDENAVPYTPASASYRVDDLYSGGSVIAETNFAPAGSTHELVIPHTSNVIIDPTRTEEVRVITVTATYDGGGKQSVAEHRYKIVNLQFV